MKIAALVGQFRATGPTWLSEIRQAAIDRFAAVGFPTRRDEDWHFTSVAPIADGDFAPLAEPGGQVRADDLAPYTFGADDWTLLVFVNGKHSPSLSSGGAIPQGIQISDLAHAPPQVAERYLTRLAPSERNAFVALNTAFFADATVIVIAPDAVIERPIHLLYVSDADAAKGLIQPRTLIVAGRHSRATVIESYVAVGDAVYCTNAVTEVEVAAGANLAHYRVQRESGRAFHVGTTEVRQERDSQYHSFSFATGAALSRINVYDVLAEPGGVATLDGLYMVDGNQHVDHQTRIEHVAPNCGSREIYKGVMDGASHGVFNGKVYVHPEAQKTDGKQTNNNLLLSERAHADTKPQLEIFADDVKCTHGATVGRLDELALFYLKSRGIEPEEARTLLTYAFAADVLERIEHSGVRDGLEALTLERFVGTEQAAVAV